MYLTKYRLDTGPITALWIVFEFNYNILANVFILFDTHFAKIVGNKLFSKLLTPQIQYR